MSGILHSFTKHSAGEYPKTIDYQADGRLPTGGTVASVEVLEAIDLLDGSEYDTGPTSIIGGTDTTDTSVTVVFQAGTDGHTYRVAIATTLSDGSVLPDVIEMTVQDRPS